MALFDTQEGLFYAIFVTRFVGGAEEARTPDLLNAIQALSQLSYSPILIWDL